METPAFELNLELAIQGDRRALSQLWRQHHPGLFGWLRAVAPDNAEDLTSDVWLEVITKLARFKGTESDFRVWLFSTARRRLIDHRRRSGRRPDSVVADLPETIESINPADIAISTMAGEEAVRLIQRVLASDQAEVVLLRVLAGLDVKQVAEVLNKSVGSVRVLQHRGLRRLAEVETGDSEKIFKRV